MNVIIDELSRRLVNIEKINSVIKDFFEYSEIPKFKLKRDYVQRFILKQALLPRTPTECVIVNEQMRKMGFKPVTIKGYGYYKNIKIKGISDAECY